MGHKSRYLFLDRDGVINDRLIGDYVKNITEFRLSSGVAEAMKILREQYEIIVVVTNQQGIGKGLMTEGDLDEVHTYMRNILGVQIDAIYHCPGLAMDNPICRKPNPGMAWKAQRDFPELDFSQSVMIGDTETDMEYAINLGMDAVFISTEVYDGNVSRHESLLEFANTLKTQDTYEG